MTRVSSKSVEQLADLQAVLTAAEATMGFVPNSMLTMAHMPQLTMAFSMLAGVAFGADLKPMLQMYQASVPDDPQAADGLPPEWVQLIAYATSLSAGCRYCQAHTSHNAYRFGIAEDKLAAVLSAQDSPLFSDAERALIDLALAAGQVPNEASDAQFAALSQHFNERQVVQIVAVIALFGFLNRWNDTMATTLEAIPTTFAQNKLANWDIGKHG